MREERGTVNNMVVSVVGDLRYGRTVHSLVRLLSNYDIKFNFVSTEELNLDSDTKNILDSKKIKYESFSSINDVIETTDILYMTRIQRERFEKDSINFIHNAWNMSRRGSSISNKVNVTGSLNLIEELNQFKLNKLIFISTIHAGKDSKSVYEKHKYLIEKKII